MEAQKTKDSANKKLKRKQADSQKKEQKLEELNNLKQRVAQLQLEIQTITLRANTDIQTIQAHSTINMIKLYDQINNPAKYPAAADAIFTGADPSMDNMLRGNPCFDNDGSHARC